MLTEQNYNLLSQKNLKYILKNDTRQEMKTLIKILKAQEILKLPPR